MIRVTCAIIRNEDDEVLVVQRGENTDHPYKWEFPGGKIMKGESEEECVIREIREELSMDIVICRRLEDVIYDYGKKKILLIPFLCDTLDDLPLLSEHIAYRWLKPESLRQTDFAEADVIVAENFLRDPGVAVITKDLTPIEDESDDEEFREMINATMGTREVEWIAKSAVENPVIFRKLLNYSFSGDRKLAFHSSWALSKSVDTHPGIFVEYLPMIVGMLGRIDNDSAHRSFLKILTQSDLSLLSEKEHGILADHCFSALRSGLSAIAIKAYSMEIVYKLAVIYPELVHELAATVNMLQGDAPAGVVARGRIILKKLAAISTKQRPNQPLS